MTAETVILFAPSPPEAAFALTPEQMSRLDRRFAHPGSLPADPTLLVQDSALLLGAFLTLKVGTCEWEGRPERTDPWPRVTEGEWESSLALTRGAAECVQRAQLPDLLGWATGVVYAFGPHLTRHYGLRSELDRLELDFLLQDGLPGVNVLRAHRLERGGTLTAWRADLQG